MRSNGETGGQLNRLRTHYEYECAFLEMRRTWTPQQLAAAIRGGYDKPLPYENGYHLNGSDDDDVFKDPADRAVDARIPIVDFDSVPTPELQKFCDDFRRALVWATRPNCHDENGTLPQMGVRMVAIFAVLRPQCKLEIKERASRGMIDSLRREIESDPRQVGRFFRRPLGWVRECSSAVQLGKRTYSMVYVLDGDLINSSTCAAIGSLDNKTRQAANKTIQDFRDTFGGIKSLPMRGKITRKRCKLSQETR